MILQKTKYIVLISIAIMIIGLICGFAFGGLNLGIDFTGGSLTTVVIGEDFEIAKINEALANNNIKDASVLKSGTDNKNAIIRMKAVEDEATQIALADSILADVKTTYPNATLEGIDRVGGVASGEMVRNAFLAVLIACGLMLIYIWIRFELYSGISAVIGLLHNVCIMTAVVCIFRIQINSAYIAACLTIVGYSINDTIVLFDRIRENHKDRQYKNSLRIDVANVSIKETLPRTLNTSITTLIMIIALYIFGVDSIKEFALPIIIGLIAGTYSSIFIATRLWVMLGDKFEKKDKYAKNTQSKKPKKAKA